MEELLSTLAKLNIAVKLRGSKLDVYDPDGNLSATLLSSLKKYKQEIINLLANLDNRAAYTSIPAVDQKPFYALSSAQKRLYFLHTLNPSSLAYNMPQIQHFEGIPDKVNLEKAFNLLIDRHEILRTTFHLQEDEPVQKVHARLDFSVSEYSTADTSTDRVFHDFVRPFDLERGPLLRAAIVTLPDGAHYLMIDMHHIITDGLSYNIMLHDFVTLYKGQSLPQLRLQYRDFAEWQQGEAQQKEMARQKEFWRSEFSDLPPVLDLPQDHERPQVKTYAGDTFERQSDKVLYVQLKSLARRSGSTVYTVLLSAFQIMLSRLGRQKDFVVGTPVSGRQHADLEYMIGFFVNTIPIRMSLDGDLTYLDYLKKLQPKVVDCFANQLFQYEEMVDELKIVRDSSRNPLFDVLFTFENFAEGAANASEGSGPELQTAKFDLSLLAVESGGLLQLQFEFSTDLFEQKTIERFAAYYENILRSIVAHPNAKLSSIEFLPDAERQHLLHTLNPSPTAYPTDKTLVDLFEAQVDKNPKNTAIVFEGRSWTYEALDREANQLAHFLMTTYDLQKEDLISIQLERSDWLIVSLLAVLKTACAYVPIDSAYPAERIRHIQQDSRCKASIDSAFLEVYRNQTKFDSSRPLIARKPSDLAYVIYTSGSTGQPKGVMVEHGGLVNLCYWHQDVYGLTAASRGTLFAGVAFDASAWEIYPYLLCGASLWPIANSEWRLQVDQLIQFFVENQISHTFLPPLVCQELAESDSALPDLKILTGGDVLSLSKSPKLSIYNNYGPTENTVVTTHFDL
ncbi:MAG: condensation domain-containing protein, partial [Bacteroidota bacterium]